MDSAVEDDSDVDEDSDEEDEDADDDKEDSDDDVEVVDEVGTSAVADVVTVVLALG